MPLLVSDSVPAVRIAVALPPIVAPVALMTERLPVALSVAAAPLDTIVPLLLTPKPEVVDATAARSRPSIAPALVT